MRLNTVTYRISIKIKRNEDAVAACVIESYLKRGLRDRLCMKPRVTMTGVELETVRQGLT